MTPLLGNHSIFFAILKILNFRSKLYLAFSQLWSDGRDEKIRGRAISRNRGGLRGRFKKCVKKKNWPKKIFCCSFELDKPLTMFDIFVQKNS